MKAIVLCGGLATRIKKKYNQTPKFLIKIRNKPFAHYQLKYLKKNGIKEVILCTSHLKEKIKKEIGNGSKFGLIIKYSDDGKELLGTGGAIKKALQLVDKYFLIVDGDTFFPFSLNKYKKLFKKRKHSSIIVNKNLNLHLRHNISIANNGKIKGYRKKSGPGYDFMDCGIRFFKKEKILRKIKKKKFDLGYIYNLYIKQQKLHYLEIDKKVYEIGSFEGMKEFEKFLKNDHK